MITLDHIVLHLLDLPQKEVFQSGIGFRKSKETLVVEWVDKEGRLGYGECSCRPDPYYSAEFLQAAVLLIKTFIAPQLRPRMSLAEFRGSLSKVRGWGFTKAAVEAAAIQILRQSDEHYHPFANLKPKPLQRVPVGISLGIYTDADALKQVVQQAISEGYQRLKFKISPKVDTRVFDAINPLLFDHKVYLGFDANGSFQMKDLDKLAYFFQTYDTILEQPFSPNRFDVLLAAKERYPTLRICFDEEVKSLGDLIKLHRLGVMDELNLKVGRVGGLLNSVEIIQYCQSHSISCWIGGMFETGIGRLQNLEVASYLPDAIAHDLSPSSRYFKEDIVAPDIHMDQGWIPLSQARQSVPIPERIEKYTVQKIKIEIQNA